MPFDEKLSLHDQRFIELMDLAAQDKVPPRMEVLDYWESLEARTGVKVLPTQEELDADFADLLVPDADIKALNGAKKIEPVDELEALIAETENQHAGSFPDTNTTGGFPKYNPKKTTHIRRCTPGAAGLLALFIEMHENTVVVIKDLINKASMTGRFDPELEEKIKKKTNTANFIKSLAISQGARLSLPDWERRLPAETKLKFATLACAQHSDAKAISFRLGHEVAEAALSAPKGPTDYLVSLLKRLGITPMVIVFERSDSESTENNPYHIHGIALIPNSVTEEAIRKALAPNPNTRTIPPIRGYRQRYDNKAIDIQPLRTPGIWSEYITREVYFTAHYMNARPDYTSRQATKAGRDLYEKLRAWMKDAK